MPKRREARDLALQILYRREITHESLSQVMESLAAQGDRLPAFAVSLLQGVEKYQDKIDPLIDKYTDNWALERMPLLDRNIIRLGLFEMLYEDDIPYGVSINEAVELAKIYGTEDSSKFINGVLGKIAADLQESSKKKSSRRQSG